MIRYEKSYNEEAKLKAAEEEKAKAEKEKDIVKSVAVSKPDGAEATQPLKKATSSAEQDLDVFLLGDLGDSDGPGIYILGKHSNLSLFPLFHINISLLICYIASIAYCLYFLVTKLAIRKKERGDVM